MYAPAFYRIFSDGLIRRESKPEDCRTAAVEGRGAIPSDSAVPDSRLNCILFAYIWPETDIFFQDAFHRFGRFPAPLTLLRHMRRMSSRSVYAARLPAYLSGRLPPCKPPGLLRGTGKMEDTSEVMLRTKILAELYQVTKELSEDEQFYLLDIAKALK